MILLIYVQTKEALSHSFDFNDLDTLVNFVCTLATNSLL